MLKELFVVFTEGYKHDTRLQEFYENNLHLFKLNDYSESVDDKVQRLIEKD